MELFIPMVLTITSFYIILVILKKIERFVFKKTKYRQSDIHEAYRHTIAFSSKKPARTSQSEQRLQSSSVNVIIVDDMAYWVVDNIFYCADFINGHINTEESRPVDTENMSKEEVEKMMFILDKLGRNRG